MGQRIFRLVNIAAKLGIVGAAFCLLYPAQRLALWRGSSWAGRLPVYFHRLILACLGVRVTLEGTPSPQRPLLLTANHVSWLDISLLGSRLPLSFIAKSEVKTWPVVGLFARLQRTIFIDRQSRQATASVSDEMDSAWAPAIACCCLPRAHPQMAVAFCRSAPPCWGACAPP